MTLRQKIDRRDELEEVRDQGPYPTCLSHATSSVHRELIDLDAPLSAESLHYYATGADWSSGSSIQDLRRALRAHGQPEDRHCDPLPEESLHNWAPPTDVIAHRTLSSSIPPLSHMVEDLIADYHLPVLGISFPEEFYNPNPPWVISAGEPQGRHAVVGIGLAENEGDTAVLIRNSWGKDWGDSGHAWLDRSFLESHLEAVLQLDGDDT